MNSERCGKRTWRADGSWQGVIAVALLSVASVALSQEVRTWTDSTGAYSIQAKFAGSQAGKVTLQKPDGAQLEIPLEKLSAADQEYVRQQLAAAAANPFKPVAPNPFQPAGAAPPGVGVGPAVPSAGVGVGPAAPPAGVSPNWTAAKKIDVIGSGEWKLPQGAAPAPGGSVKPIALPAKANFFENAVGMAISGDGHYAVVGYNCKPPGRDVKITTTVAICDLAEGLARGSGAIEGELLVPLAIHDDGVQVLMRRNEFGFGNQERLEIWTLGPGGVGRGRAWMPYENEKGGDRDVKWAAYLDENRLATCSAGGRLAIWDAATIRPICYLDIKGRPTLSPDRKYIAFLADKQVGVFDVKSQTVAALESAPLNGGVMAFTPSGNRIVAANFADLYVWDFATGQLQRECRLEGVHIGEDLICPSEEHILAGNSRLYDFTNQVNVWEYRGAQKAGVSGGVCWMAVIGGERQPSALVPAQLPHQGVAEKLKTAMADPQFFVFKPGTTVKIDVGKIADSAARTKVQDALVKKLQESGCKVGANGTISLVAQVEEAPKKEELHYRSFGSIGYEEYKVTKFISRLEFVYDGKTAWKSEGNNLPGFIVHLERDQTMKQYLKEREKPNYDYFEQVQLPKLLTRPTGSPTLGSSEVTVSGIH